MCYYFDNRWMVDPLVNLVGRVTRLVAEAGDAFDGMVVDRIVNLVGRVTWLVAHASDVFDREIIDGLVNLAGQIGADLSALSGWADDVVVDGFVNGVALVTQGAGRVLRPIQTGKVQNYLLVTATTVLALAGLYLIYR